MEFRLKLNRLAGLLLGLALGLAFAAALAWLLGWLAVPGEAERISLRNEAPVGAFGPLVIERPAGSSVPGPSAFTIDERTAVGLESESGLVLLAPVQPLSPGEHSLHYQPAAGEPLQWDFQVRQAEPLYLKEAGGVRGLYRWRQGSPLLLSGDHLVTDYEPTRQGDSVAYAASNSEGGTDIWLVDREGEERRNLVRCGADRCDQLAWSPEGDRLAFSRQGADDPGPRLWTVGLVDEGANPLFRDEARLGTDPNWSPDGRYLAFFDPAANGVRLLDVDTVREQVVPNRTGVSGSWTGEGQQLFLPLLVFQGEEPVTHLYRLDVEQQDLKQILGERGGWRQMGEPALPFQGQWMAVAALRGSPGAGLKMFLVDLGDQSVRPLAEDPRYSYGGPSWDPLGQQLLFQRFPVGQVQAEPDILLWQVDQAEPQVLIEGAGSADWLH